MFDLQSKWLFLGTLHAWRFYLLFNSDIANCRLFWKFPSFCFYLPRKFLRRCITFANISSKLHVICISSDISIFISQNRQFVGYLVWVLHINYLKALEFSQFIWCLSFSPPPPQHFIEIGYPICSNYRTVKLYSAIF